MDFVSHPEVGAVYITPAQAAQILGVNQGEIKRLVWEKHLDHQRVGGKTMFYRTEVEAMVGRIPPAKRVLDAIELYKNRQAAYGIPENQQFCNGETK